LLPSTGVMPKRFGDTCPVPAGGGSLLYCVHPTGCPPTTPASNPGLTTWPNDAAGNPANAPQAPNAAAAQPTTA
jgi:hypothetical protein